MIEIRKGKGDKHQFVYGVYDKRSKIWYWFSFRKDTKELFDFALYPPLVKKPIRPLIKGIFKARYGDIRQ